MEQVTSWIMAVSLGGFLFACRHSPKPQEDNYDVKLETDDSESQTTAQLVDVARPIEDYINGIIDRVRRDLNPKQEAWTDELKQQLLSEVQRLSSGPRKGSGIGVGGMEISVLTEIEAYLMEKLSPERHQIKFTKYKDSIYGTNPVGILSWKVPSQMSTATADHSIAPTVRIADVLVGIDKFAHFLEQGYWYFDATRRQELMNASERREFGMFMEGDPDLPETSFKKYKQVFAYYCSGCVRLGGFGYYGAKSTGVISNADNEANESGFEFYQALWDEPGTHRLRFADFDVRKWNEQFTKSKFIPGFKVKTHEKDGV